MKKHTYTIEINAPDDRPKALVTADLQVTQGVPVVEHVGRWYITFGQAGFNSPNNNSGGYPSQASALAAIKRYANKGRKR